MLEVVGKTSQKVLKYKRFYESMQVPVVHFPTKKSTFVHFLLKAYFKNLSFASENVVEKIYKLLKASTYFDKHLPACFIDSLAAEKPGLQGLVCKHNIFV